MKNYDFSEIVNLKNIDGLQVVLFGAGVHGQIAYHALNEIGINVNYFCDSNKRKQGIKFCGIPTLSLEELKLLKDP